MTALERVQAASGALKVFPLPSAVLLPHSALPLHIFEPRYRALVHDCLATDRVFALAQLAPGWESDYEGRPPLLPLACAGFIAMEDALPDGRFELILGGVARVEVLEELPARALYREVRARVLPDPDFAGPEESQLRSALLMLAGRLPPEDGKELLQAASKVAGGALADVVAAALVSNVDRRYRLLGTLDVRQRLQRVVEELGDLLGELPPLHPSGPVN